MSTNRRSAVAQGSLAPKVFSDFSCIGRVREGPTGGTYSGSLITAPVCIIAHQHQNAIGVSTNAQMYESAHNSITATEEPDMTKLEALATDYANALVQYNDRLMAHAMYGGRELHREVLHAADVVYTAQDALNREAAQVAARLER